MISNRQIIDVAINIGNLFDLPIVMSLITVIIVLVVVGFVLWAINRFIPMQPWVKNLLNVVVVIILILWLLKAFGLVDVLDIRVGK